MAFKIKPRMLMDKKNAWTQKKPWSTDKV